jgi:hypothetical protein
MSYASCIDLEILIKEMIDYVIPSNLQWKEIVIKLVLLLAMEGNSPLG